MNTTKLFPVILICLFGSNQTRKAAFASLRRGINSKNVEELAGKMKVKGYRNGAPIQVYKAEEALEAGVNEMFDINGIPIPKEDYKDYLLVVDGNHRLLAASLYNDWLVEKKETPIQVPAIEIKLADGESLAAYLGDTNTCQKDWGGPDYANLAAYLLPDEPLLQRYSELVRSPSKPKGICLANLNLLYSPAGGICKTDFIKLCLGQSEKLTRGKVRIPIIPAGCNIEVGDKFISICKKVGFIEQEIGKRYLITEFNNLRNAHDAEFGLKVFESITEADITAMTNKNKNLIEQNVIDHFQVIIKRVKKNTPASAQTTKQ